jgi:two-component system, repressor protein LuxO
MTIMTRKGRILLIDDCMTTAATTVIMLERAGFDVHSVSTIVAGLALLGGDDARWDAVLVDLSGDDGGPDLIEQVARAANRASVIAITADASLNRAIAVMRRGAFDFLVKPPTRERLIESCTKAMAQTRQRRTVKSGRRAADRTGYHGFVGQTVAMQAIYQMIDSIAPSRATVFITGESGTGKEVAADALHRASPRRSKPFVAINCGAIPENLLESEIFGHVRGAFTGATEHRIGAARLADGGTLFLDEICELELKLQVKLLRFLQTGAIQRVGSSSAETVDVRVICATNRDPLAEIAAGRFREDLFYRLAVIPLALPPLRERGDDILLIATAFAEKLAHEEGKSITGFSDAARAYLRHHDWPGNVRELHNAVRRAVILSPGPVIDLAPLQPLFGAQPVPQSLRGAEPIAADDGRTLDRIERDAIERAVLRAGGSLPGAAKALGVSASTLYRKRERWIDGAAA